MNRRRVEPGGTPLANPITERDHAIKRLTHKQLLGFGHGLAYLDAPSGKRADHQRMDRVGRMTPATVRWDLSLAQVIHQRLGDLRAGAVACTKKQGKRHERTLSLIAGSARTFQSLANLIERCAIDLAARIAPAQDLQCVRFKMLVKRRRDRPVPVSPAKPAARAPAEEYYHPYPE